MKQFAHTIFHWTLAVLVAVLSCSCMKESPSVPDSVSDMENQDLVTVAFVLSGDAGTKATSAGSESLVQTLRIVLFDSDGAYVTSGYASGGTAASPASVSLSIPAGVYNVFAAVNFSGSYSWTSTTPNINTLKSKYINLSENSRSKLTMSGGLSGVSVSASTTSVVVPVYRHVCRVKLNSISVDFDGTDYDGKTLTVNGVYVTNVMKSILLVHNNNSFASDQDFMPEAINAVMSSSTYYNLYGYVSDSSVNALLSDTGLNVSIADNATNSTVRYFYPFPSIYVNTGANNAYACERLVIECTLDGQRCYYHVDLPGTVPNASYNISVVINGIGGSTAEQNMEKTSVTFTTTVTDWNPDTSVEGQTMIVD